MKLHFDEGEDALYLRLDDSTIVESEEVQAGVVLDFDERGEVVGIEILRVRERVPLSGPKRVQVESA